MIARYLNGQHDNTSLEWPERASAPGNGVVRLRRLAVLPDPRTGANLITMQTPVRIVTDFWSLHTDRQVHLTYHLFNDKGVGVLTSGSPAARRPEGLHRLVCHLPGGLLNCGGYSLRLLVVENGNHETCRHDGIASFTIIDQSHRNNFWKSREPSVVQPVLKWDAHRSEEKS